MSKRRPTMDEMQLVRLRLERAELATEAWRARFWEVASSGRLIPSDEDRIKHIALIGPMPDLAALRVSA